MLHRRVIYLTAITNARNVVLSISGNPLEKERALLKNSPEF